MYFWKTSKSAKNFSNRQNPRDSRLATEPTERCYAEIMAVNGDLTINFVGTNGRIAFGGGAATVGGKKLIRIDFKKYAAGAENYEYKQ